MSVATPGLFDAHLHIIDPAFPLVANQGYLPPPFTVADYRAQAEALGITGGAVVSGSFQSFDQGYLLAALAALGEGFVGVTQLPADASDREIDRLDDAGVRALRFNLRRGGPLDPAQIERCARHVFARHGWHVEFYVDAASLAEMVPLLRRLPAVSIDHLGLEAAALPTLLPLIESGVRVKATGFGRVDFEVADALKRIHRANPAALMFGTDLPSTRSSRPFAAGDIGLVEETLGADGAACVLWKNARVFYRVPPTPSAETAP